MGQNTMGKQVHGLVTQIDRVILRY